MNFRQRPPARPTGQEQRKKENRAYYTVIGVSLALIVILTVMLILKLGKKKPAATETEAEESLDFTLEEVLPDDDPLESETILHVETVTEPLPEETTEAEEGPVIVTNTEQVIVEPAATTDKAKDTEPPQTSAESTTVTEPDPTQPPPEDALQPVSLPLGFGRISSENEGYVNDTASNEMYAGSYSGTMIYSQKNIDKLTHSNKVKSIVDQLVALSSEKNIDLYGDLSGNTLAMISDSYPLTNNGSFSVTLAPVRGVTEINNVTPLMKGAKATVRVYYLAEQMISYIYSESFQADGQTIAWFEIRVELYPD
ncbi:MAG: hypothetical protein ACOYEL_03155 [Saccharofermentanales bacterium]|jgi:hypothetical protein